MELYNGFSKEKWEVIKTHPYYKKSIETIISTADRYMTTYPERPTYTKLHMYLTTGDRSEYENAYGDVRSRVNYYFLAYMVTEDEKYIPHLCDSIWDVLNMESWAIPAHVKESESLEVRRCWIELVSNTIGVLLGEIYHTIPDKLPELIKRRIVKEVRERIVLSYPKYHQGWMKGTNNWGAVCTAGVLATFLYFATPEEIEASLPQMIETNELYLTGFTEDGCCLEGYAYWVYGFTYFCRFADMLRRYTNGKIDFFKREKVHNIAKFQESVPLDNKNCVSFSDCGNTFNPNPQLSHFLKKEYPDISIPSFGTITSGLCITYLMWMDPDLANEIFVPRDHIFSDAQWYIKRSDNYCFACKAGHNREPHNHIDVGSFTMSKNNKLSFTDPGTGAYTRQYFGAERFTTVLEPSARAHSLPVINGKEQALIGVKSTVYAETPDKYEFSMENVYEDETLKTLTRRFDFLEDSIVLTDAYEFTEVPTEIVEHFVSLAKPEISDGAVKVGDITLTYDAQAYELSQRVENCIRSGYREEPLYMIDLKFKNPEKSMVLKFVFS